MKKISLVLFVSVFAVFAINAQSQQVDAATQAVEKVKTESDVVQDKTATSDVKQVEAVNVRKVSKEDAMKVKQIKNASTDVQSKSSSTKKACSSSSSKKACCASAAKNGKSCCDGKKASKKSCSGSHSKTKSAAIEQKLEN